jgi:DNA-directed RNA polymerase specialized sigma24 family protein
MSAELATEPDNDHLSTSEIHSELKKLSEADIMRIGKIGERYATRCLMDADDLLNEAITQSLSGDRRCPRNVVLTAFLAQTMRSIAFNEKRKAKQAPIQEPVDNDAANDQLLSLPDEGPTILEVVESRSELDALFALFEHDEDVEMLLMGLQDGYEPEEICGITGWGRKTYSTVRKRLRRGVDKHFPEGRQT